MTVEPGELVAIAGGSGAGKTTLLEILAGQQPPSAGQVRHDGVVRGARVSGDSRIGYVPQDDIIHLEMPLRRTLRYAARLRLPAGTSAAEAYRVVEETMDDLDLSDRAEVPVRALSGGQRKRASIAVELLTRPRLFFLDEPTSGLDPSTAAGVMRLLRRLSERGVTIVITTHEPAGIDMCDRVVFLARDGHLAFTGAPTEARRYFGVRDLAEVYEKLADEATPERWAQRFTASRPTTETGAGMASLPIAVSRDVDPVGAIRQWWLLTRRNTDVLLRNRLTLAILLGSPVLVTAMMATLFKRGAFGVGGGAGVGPAQIMFWIAFDGFFFGLTYGLLQIIGEMAVFRRERLAGLSVGAYVASKVTTLLPVLAGVSAVLLGVLRVLGRLPAVGWHVYVLLFVHDRDRGDVRACARTAGVSCGIQRRAGRPRPADALLPAGSVRWRHRSGRRDGHPRASDQLRSVQPSRIRSAGSRPGSRAVHERDAGHVGVPRHLQRRDRAQPRCTRRPDRRSAAGHRLGARSTLRARRVPAVT